MAKIRAVYEVRCPAGEAEAVARFIAVEQTVEVPEHLIEPRIDEEIVGDLVSVDPLDDGRYAVGIEYDAALTHGQLPQLLNLVYGNATLMRSVRLARLDLPDELLARFKGPNFGGLGLRETIGVFDRPLLCTALKPRGLTDKRLADLARDFALGGADIVKDDHNLVDGSFEAFERRITRCAGAIAEANGRTGASCLYVANLCVPVEDLDRCVECTLRAGGKGVLIPPLIAGLDTVRRLAATYPIFVMGHPSFTGTFFRDREHGIDPGVLYGTLYRLAGIDVSILVNHGGRFEYTLEECQSVADATRAPLGRIAQGLPAPAGGMQYDRIPDLARDYGLETCLLIGGAVLGHGDDLEQSTRAFVDRIKTFFPARPSS